jgi:hypothetical protein
MTFTSAIIAVNASICFQDLRSPDESGQVTGRSLAL